MYGKEIEKVLITNDDVRNRLKEVAKKIGDDYKGKDVLFICVLLHRGFELRRRHGLDGRSQVYQRLLDADCGQKRNHRRRYRGHGHHSQLP